MSVSSTLPHPAVDQVIDLLLDAVCVVDRHGRFLYVSAASEQVFGYTPEEMVGRTVWDLVHPEDQELTRAQAERVMSGNSSTQIENRYIRKDGSVVHIMWSARWSEREQVRIGVARDVTRRKQAERAQDALLRISQAAHRAGDLAQLLQEIRGIISELVPCRDLQVVLRDADSGRWIHPGRVLDGAASPGDVEGEIEPWTARVVQTQSSLLLDREALAAMATGPVDREVLPHCWLGIPLMDDQGMMGVLAVECDASRDSFSEADRQVLHFVSDQVTSAIRHRAMLSRLERLAQYDVLTGLPNRALLNDRLLKALRNAERAGHLLALLFVDMNNFKRINDRHGHAAGDRLLQLAAARLTGCVRTADTVARLGGDEFVVVIEGLAAPEPIEGLMAKIRQAFSRPFELEEQSVQASLSIGLALYPRDGLTPDTLLQYADRRMYAAKADVVEGGDTGGPG